MYNVGNSNSRCSGLVDAEKLEPGDLVGVNKDSYLILDTLPPGKCNCHVISDLSTAPLVMSYDLDLCYSMFALNIGSVNRFLDI